MIRKYQALIHILPELLHCLLLLPTVQIRLLPRVVEDVLIHPASILPFMLFLRPLYLLLLPPTIIALLDMPLIVLLSTRMPGWIDQMRQSPQRVRVLFMRNGLYLGCNHLRILVAMALISLHTLIHDLLRTRPLLKLATELLLRDFNLNTGVY